MPGMGGMGMMMPNMGMIGQNLAFLRGMAMMHTVGTRAGMTSMGMPHPKLGGLGSMLAQIDGEGEDNISTFTQSKSK